MDKKNERAMTPQEFYAKKIDGCVDVETLRKVSKEIINNLIDAIYDYQGQVLKMRHYYDSENTA